MGIQLYCREKDDIKMERNVVRSEESLMQERKTKSNVINPGYEAAYLYLLRQKMEWKVVIVILKSYS